MKLGLVNRVSGIHLNFKVDGGHFGVWFFHRGVKGDLSSPHHIRFEDIATPSIEPKEALVQMHLHVCKKMNNS